MKNFFGKLLSVVLAMGICLIVPANSFVFAQESNCACCNSGYHDELNKDEMLNAVVSSFTNSYEVHSDGNCCHEHHNTELSEIDMLELNIPEDERLIKINEDGTFITEVMDDGELLLSYRRPNCEHELHFVGMTSEKKSYNAQYPDKCYKTRLIEITRCRRCGKEFKVYRRWVDHNHDFPWFGFGDKCKECGYKK